MEPTQDRWNTPEDTGDHGQECKVYEGPLFDRDQ